VRHALHWLFSSFCIGGSTLVPSSFAFGGRTQLLGFGWIYLDGLIVEWFMSLDFGLSNPMARLSRRVAAKADAARIFFLGMGEYR